jgi:hypothetical protein
MNNDDASVTGKPARRAPWNKGKLIGPKPPLRQGHVWSIRTRLQLERRSRDLACTNVIENMQARSGGRSVKRWRHASLALRWAAPA